MWGAVPQEAWIVDAQESCIRVAKRSVMVIAVMKGVRFADTQESCFEAWKRSHMGCAALQFGRYADAQESRIQAANRSNMGSAAPPVYNLLMLRNRLFGLRNIQIWAVTKWKDFVCWITGIVFSGFETFKYGLCCPGRLSICWYSGIFSNCKTFI